MVTMTIATLFLVVSVQLCTFVVLAQQHKSPKTFTYLSVTDNPSELQNALSPGDSMPEFVRDFLSFRDVPIAGVDYELRPIPIPVPVHYEVPVQRPSEDQEERSPSELTDKAPLSSHEYSQPGTGHRYIEGSDQRSMPHPRPEVIVAEYPEYNKRPTNPEIQEDTKYPQHYISAEPAVEYQAETGPTYKGQSYGTRIRPSGEQSTQNDNTYQLYPPSREVTEQHYPSTDQSSSSQSNSQEVPQTYYEVGQPQFERKPLHEHPGQYASQENSSPPSQAIYYSRQEVPEQLPEQPVSYYNRGDEDNSSGERKYKPPPEQPTYVYETQEGIPEESLTPHYRPEPSVDRNTPQYSVEDPYTDSVQVQYDQRAYPIAEQPKNVPSRYLQQPQPVYEKEPREGEYQNPSRESYAAGSPLSVQYYDNKNNPYTSVYYHGSRPTDREESKSPTVKNNQFSNAYSPAFSESQTGMFHKIPSSFDALIDTDTSFLEKLKPEEQQRSEQQQRKERAYYPKVSSTDGHVESARFPSSTSAKHSSLPYVQDHRYHSQAPTSSVHSPDTHPSFQALSDDSLDHKTTGYTYEDLVNNRRLPGEPIISYRREEDTLPLPQRLLRARKPVFSVPEQEVYEKNGSNPRNSYFYSFHLPRDKELSILDFRTVGKDGKPIKKADRIQGSIQRAVRKLDKRVPEKRKDGSLKGPLERNSELSSSKVSFSEEDVHLSKRTKRDVQYTRTDAMPNKLKSSILAQKYGRSSRHPSVFKFFRVVAMAGPTGANQTVLIDSRVFTDKHGSPVQILTETRPHVEKISELGHEQNIEIPTCAKNTTSLYCLEDEDYPRDLIFDALSSNQTIADLLKSKHLTEEEVSDRHLPKGNEDLQCPLMRRKIFPLRIKDTKGLWQTVVNVEDFRQGVWIETCVFLEESTDDEREFQTMSSECTQNMSVHHLWIYSAKTGFSLDSFWLPSSCTQTV